MRIVFNLLNVGLGNNGGSRTLIRCAETLQELGYDTLIASRGDKYTWHKIGVPIVSSLPKCDVIVATGIGSVKGTVKSKADRKFYYIRGFEIWRTSEAKLISSFRSLRCIVNSEWLARYLKKQRIYCDLVYPGLDFERYAHNATDRENIIGGLFSSKHRTKRHKDVLKIAERLGCKCVLLNRDIKNPTPDKLTDFYNSIKVWITPSELEGLHNCPMEASLAGCGLVATDHKRGGTIDYAHHGETCLRYKARHLDIAAQYVDRLMGNDEEREKLQTQMTSLLREKIGTRKDNMLKMIEIFR